MFKLEEDLLDHTIRTNGPAFNQQEELRMLTHDITRRGRRIADQITLIGELAWEAQETASAKIALHEMQETLSDWYAHRDLLLKLRAAEPQPA